MFSFFSSKKNILKTDLLMGMKDGHANLLPGVEDGVSAVEEAKKAIKYFEDMGVERMFLTPHIMTDCPNNNAEFLKQRFEEFKKSCPSKIEFRLAAEYMLDEKFIGHLNKEVLSFDNKHLLVETSYFSAPIELDTLIYDIMATGYQPVLAHPERYLYMSDAKLMQLLSRGVKLQLNFLSLAGLYGKHVSVRAKSLLLSGKYTFVGSDFHHQERYERVLSRIILKKEEIEAIRILLENNRKL